jgi:4-amino-4-deoxy-L-arabinose transferase-like glycosyltransferase
MRIGAEEEESVNLSPTEEPRDKNQDPSHEKVAPGGLPLLLILATGAAIRLALWLGSEGLPLTAWDERDYNTLALNLLRHGEFAFTPGRPLSERPPLYPAFIAGVYWLSGEENYQAVRLIQVCISLVSVILLYRFAASLYSRRVGLWACGLYALYPSLLAYNSLLLTEVLFTFLLCAACLIFLRAYQQDRCSLLLLLGIVLGLASLTRSVLWLFPIPLAGLVFLTWRGRFRRRIVAVASLLAAFCVTLIPWAIRTTRLEKTFIAIDTNSGRNFMMGNYAYTPLYRTWDAIAFQGDQAWYSVLAAKEPSYPTMTQGQRDKAALRAGIQFALAHPWLTIQRDVIKFYRFWQLERELVAGAARGNFGKLSKWGLVLLAGVIFASYAFVILTGLFGILLFPPEQKAIHWFLVLTILFICAMHTATFAHSRYHLPLIPLICVYSASALVNGRHLWQHKKDCSFWLATGLSSLLVAGWLIEIIAVDGARFMEYLRSLV